MCPVRICIISQDKFRFFNAMASFGTGKNFLACRFFSSFVHKSHQVASRLLRIKIFAVRGSILSIFMVDPERSASKAARFRPVLVLRCVSMITAAWWHCFARKFKGAVSRAGLLDIARKIIYSSASSSASLQLNNIFLTGPIQVQLLSFHTFEALLRWACIRLSFKDRRCLSSRWQYPPPGFAAFLRAKFSVQASCQLDPVWMKAQKVGKGFEGSREVCSENTNVLNALQCF